MMDINIVERYTHPTLRNILIVDVLSPSETKKFTSEDVVILSECNNIHNTYNVVNHNGSLITARELPEPDFPNHFTDHFEGDPPTINCWVCSQERSDDNPIYVCKAMGDLTATPDERSTHICNSCINTIESEFGKVIENTDIKTKLTTYTL